MFQDEWWRTVREDQIRGAIDVVEIDYSWSQPAINLTTASRPFSKAFALLKIPLKRIEREAMLVPVACSLLTSSWDEDNSRTAKSCPLAPGCCSVEAPHELSCQVSWTQCLRQHVSWPAWDDRSKWPLSLLELQLLPIHGEMEELRGKHCCFWLTNSSLSSLSAEFFMVCSTYYVKFLGFMMWHVGLIRLGLPNLGHF